MANQRLPDILESDEDQSSVYSEDQCETPLLGHSPDTQSETESQNRKGKRRSHNAFDWCSCLGCVASFAAVILVATVVAVPLVFVQLSHERADEVALYWHSKETMKMDIDPLLYTGFHLDYDSPDAGYVATAYLFDRCPPLVPVEFEFSNGSAKITNTEAYIVYYYLHKGSQVNVSVCARASGFFLPTFDFYVLKGDENYEKWLSFAQLNAVKHLTSAAQCSHAPAHFTYDVEEDDYYFFLMVLGYFSLQTYSTLSANYTVLSMQYNTSALEPKDHCTANSTSRACGIHVPSGFAFGDCTVVALEDSNSTDLYQYTDVGITYDQTLNVWLLVLLSVFGLMLIVVVCVSIICCVRCYRRRKAMKRMAARDLIIQ